jgi:hypothetical protein
MIKGEPPHEDGNHHQEDDKDDKATPFFLYDKEGISTSWGVFSVCFKTYGTGGLCTTNSSCHLPIPLFQIMCGGFGMDLYLIQDDALLFHHHLHVHKELVQVENRLFNLFDVVMAGLDFVQHGARLA